jgi:hypothetical protein
MAATKKILKVLGVWIFLLFVYGFVREGLGVPKEYNTLIGVCLLFVAVLVSRTPKRSANPPNAPFGKQSLEGVSCPDCHSEQQAGARFCKQCGAQLPESTSKEFDTTAVPVRLQPIEKPESRLKELSIMVAIAVVLVVLIGVYETLKMRSDPRFSTKIDTITVDRVSSTGCSELVYISGTVKRLGQSFAPSLGLVGMNGPLFVLGDTSGEVTVRLPYGSQVPPLGQKVTAFGNIACPPNPIAPNRFPAVGSNGLRPN